MFVFALLVHWPFFLHQPTILPHNQTGFFSRQLDSFFHSTVFTQSVTHGLLVGTMIGAVALLMNQLLLEHRMFLRSNHLGGLTVILFSGLMPMGVEFNETLVTTTLIALIATQLARLHNHPSPKSTLFNIGLMLGLAGMIQSATLIFVIPAYISISLARPFRLAEWLLFGLGLIVPFYFLAALDYLTGGLFLMETPRLFFRVPSFFEKSDTLLLAILPILFAITGFMLINRHINKLLIQARKNWSLLFLFGLTSLSLPFFLNAPDQESLYFILPFLSVIASAFFYFIKPLWLVYCVQLLLLVMGWGHALFPNWL